MTGAGGGGDQERVFVEPRWPIALVVSSYLALIIVLRIYEPDRPTLGTRWLVPGIMAHRAPQKVVINNSAHLNNPLI